MSKFVKFSKVISYTAGVALVSSSITAHVYARKARLTPRVGILDVLNTFTQAYSQSQERQKAKTNVVINNPVTSPASRAVNDFLKQMEEVFEKEYKKQ